MNLLIILEPVRDGLIASAEKQKNAEIQTAKGSAMRLIASLEQSIQSVNDSLAVTIDEAEAEFESNKTFILDAFSGDTSHSIGGDLIAVKAPDNHVEKDEVIVNLPKGAELLEEDILSHSSASENA